jgi:hypothetical protein
VKAEYAASKAKDIRDDFQNTPDHSFLFLNRIISILPVYHDQEEWLCGERTLFPLLKSVLQDKVRPTFHCEREGGEFRLQAGFREDIGNDEILAEIDLRRLSALAHVGCLAKLLFKSSLRSDFLYYRCSLSPDMEIVACFGETDTVDTV